MGTMSLWHWLILLGLGLLLFGGRGKISEMMGDVAKGIKSFKKGLAEDEDPKAAAEKAKALEGQGSAQPLKADPQPSAPTSKAS